MEGGGSGGGVRLHVGGLGESVGRDDLLKIFSPMGSVEAIEFVRTKGRSFAYIDFSPASENSLTKLFSTYNGCKWKGGKLRLEKAKEHYMARLKREWAESASVPTDETVKAPDKSSAPSTHLNIFFPRLRKVKAMPLSGTGKHKYSFQRVAVPSLLPKTFCDCEEHSASLTPRETHARDLEAINVGINEEEVNIMNSVMNKLLQRDDSIIINEKDDSFVNENDEIIVDTKDNIVINVVSNGKDMMDTELDILSRKRKSMLDQTPAGEGAKGKPIHPNKKRQSIIPEGSGRQEASLAIREKKKPSEVDPDEPSRTTGVKRSTDNISWSQKSSWKALVANGTSSNFSVSSFLPDFSSSKAVQPASDTDVEGSDHTESEDTHVEGSEHSESEESDVEGSEPEESDVEGSEHSEPDDNDVEGSEHSEPEDADVVGSDHSEPEDADVEGSDLSEPEDAEGSDHSEPEDTDLVGSDHSEPEDTDLVGSDHSEPEDTVVADISVDAETVELAASTEGDGEDRSLNVEKDENLAEDSDAEKESSEDSVDHDVDEEETERGELEGCKKSAGGSLWLQKASWTQLVRDQNASFSITQLFPGSASDKSEAVSVSDSGDGQFSNSNQSGTGMKQRDDSYSTNGVEAAVVHGASSSTALRNLKENEQIVKAKNASGGSRLGAKKPIRREIGSGETCAFMRSETSVNEWKRAKKALGEPGRKKKSEE
ncbi:RNA-binding (RRM/RBD/RNP motifs) family protein [Raphanus sativus]|uniref:Protein REPRESSOR OF SILENCING 3 isoform X1 n=1 Tax=Raphanus sativus TaxID=3726 RepID=A0A6J0L938_RAPSA|nr:protein REPRESSOR OF SILENCING 3 isoform X1 [Raphanus sativus]KAJ4875241.1 RNA-binding (RRM/RBD/RNP motifs) family protein [Raphanus sativus]